MKTTLLKSCHVCDHFFEPKNNFSLSLPTCQSCIDKIKRIDCNNCMKSFNPIAIISYNNKTFCYDCYNELFNRDQEQSQRDKTKDQLIKVWIEQTKAKVIKELDL